MKFYSSFFLSTLLVMMDNFGGFESSYRTIETVDFCHFKFPSLPVVNSIYNAFKTSRADFCQNLLAEMNASVAIFCEFSSFCGFDVDFSQQPSGGNKLVDKRLPIDDICQFLMAKSASYCETLKETLYRSRFVESEFVLDEYQLQNC